MSKGLVDLSVSRRVLLKNTAAAAAAAAMPCLSLTAAAEEIKKLEKEGWSKHPVACTMCGAFCGLLAMKKEGEEISESTVRIFPNPGHPQQGYCGRGAAAMWVWNHPLRLRKPLKRVGERGEGKFAEVTWDEALDAIASKLRKLVEENGESCISTTSHSFSGFSKWLTFPLGSPNDIGHQSTCNLGGIAARDWVFGKGFSGAGKLEPDYAHLRYLLLIGRSMGSSMGALHTLNEARARGCHVVAIDPRMPDIAYGNADWVGIRPGTDAAFILGLINQMIENKTFDREFMIRHTNGAYLIKSNGTPLTEADFRKDGSASVFVVANSAGTFSLRSVKRDEKGAAIGFIEDQNFKPELEFSGEAILANGEKETVRTAFSVLKKLAGEYTPQKVQEITGISPEVLKGIAFDYANNKGCIDDGWYTSKNGTDVELYQLICIANAMNGNIDQPGGLIVTAGAGFKIPGVAAGKGPNGETWAMAKEKRIDKIVYPETSGTYSVALDAAVSGKPYPIKAAFFVGTTMFHRQANAKKLAENLKKLDLVVVQDVLPQELVDYADYVLPATYFMERRDMSGVKWARDGSIYLSDPQLNPPKGCEARHDVWILLEILRRAYPERAERVGYKGCGTAEEFNAYFGAFVDRGYKKLLDDCEKKMPGSAEAIRKSVSENGWATIKTKKYGEYPYVKPFGTPSGKVEIYGFKSFSKPGYAQAIAPISGYILSPAYTQPKADSNEFILVSGKNCVTCSGLNMFTHPTRFMGDRTVWMNPHDAARLGIRTGDMIEVEGIDSGYKAQTRVTVTKRVVQGAVFAYGFSGGVRTKTLIKDPNYQFVKEGINSHWYDTGYAQPVVGNVANNSAVRINKVRG